MRNQLIDAKKLPENKSLVMCGTCGTVRNSQISSAGEDTGGVRNRSGNPL